MVFLQRKATKKQNTTVQRTVCYTAVVCVLTERSFQEDGRALREGRSVATERTVL